MYTYVHITLFQYRENVHFYTIALITKTKLTQNKLANLKPLKISRSVLLNSVFIIKVLNGIHHRQPVK